MKIKKSTLDEMIQITKKIWDEPEEAKYKNFMRKRIDRVIALCKTEDVDWSALLYLMDALYMGKGFAPDADNELVYAVVRLMGWEVVSDGEEHSASE